MKQCDCAYVVCSIYQFYQQNPRLKERMCLGYRAPGRIPGYVINESMCQDCPIFKKEKNHE